MAKKKAKKRRVTRKKKHPNKRTRRRVGVTSSSRSRARSPKKSPRKRRKKKAPEPKVIKAVERVSVERTLQGKRKKRRRYRPKRSPSRRRTVGAKGSGLLIGLAIGAGAYLLLSTMSKQQPVYPPYQGQYGQLLQTNNVTRNTQSQDILNYAMAAGLAVNAIANLIDKLNTSSDNEVKQIYDHVSSTGDVGVWV